MKEFLESNFDTKSHMGHKLAHNEDFVAFHIPAKEKDRIEQGCLFVVADGVGWAEAGEWPASMLPKKSFSIITTNPPFPIESD